MTFVADQGSFVRSISPSIYTRRALVAAQDAFKAYCKVTTVRGDADRLQVVLRPLDIPSEQIPELVLAFWNFYLDKSIQERLG